MVLTLEMVLLAERDLGHADESFIRCTVAWLRLLAKATKRYLPIVCVLTIVVTPESAKSG